MSRGIKINCRKVYETGLTYHKAAELIKENQNQLSNISSSIGEIWTGGDSNNFQVSFNQHIKALEEIISFMEGKSSVLKGNAMQHNNVDNTFGSKMKRSEVYDK